MYKAAIRAMIRHHVRRLNEGDYQPLLDMAADDAELAFPGDNSWSGHFRPQQKSRARHTTHRGTAELEWFARRFVDAGLRLEVEDIVVNGPPWNTRIVVRASNGAVDDDGVEVYTNRAALFIEARWGKIHRWEDFIDTERVAEWDRRRGVGESSAVAAAAD